MTEQTNRILVPATEMRALNFFNSVRSSKEITDRPQIKDDPFFQGMGYRIGEVVAERIIEVRQTLADQKFTSIDQLEAVKGIGEDKIHDILFSFQLSAAEAFLEDMYSNVIGDNWQLKHHTMVIRDREEFLQRVKNESDFRNTVGRHYGKVLAERGMDPEAVRLAGLLLSKAHFETFDLSHFGGIDFGFWFYRFDADNWFSFDKIWTTCERYLSYYSHPTLPIELRMFKAHDIEGLQPLGSSDIIPVVVNYPEQAISIWECELFD